jgi:hypothetical protein
VTSEKFDKIIKAISDLLWILDFYQGQKMGDTQRAVTMINAWKSEDAKS